MSENTLKKQALLIGINQYQMLPQLRFARQDAEAVGDSLKKNYNFSDNEVILLTDNRTGYYNPINKHIIQKHLDDLAHQNLDLFVFGFWGHGLYRNSERYLCSLDVMHEAVEATGLPFKKLQELISNIRAKNTCLILDCCQSVHDRGEAELMTDNEQTLLANAARDIGLKRKEVNPEFVSNVAILNSCTKGQSAYEWDDKKHGIFTAHLLEAMERRYDNVSKIISYLDDHVTQTALKLGKIQKPFYKLEGSITLPTNYQSNISKPTEGKIDVRKNNVNENSSSLKSQSKLNCINIPQDGLSLEEACNKIADNGIINLEPGIYTISNTITLNRNFTIRSKSSNFQDVEIRSNCSIFCITGASPLLIGLTIRAKGDEARGFDIKGGIPVIQSCNIISDRDVGVQIAGKKANPEFRSCSIHNCGQNGVWVYDEGTGEFDNCDIYGNAYPGIAIQTGGNPTVTGCKIHDEKDVGVWVLDNGKGEFTNCDIYGNENPGIAVETGGNPTVTGCKIHDGKQNGMVVYDNGKGQFNNCDIYGNELPGIGVVAGGNPTVTDCKIHDGKHNGVSVLDNGAGEFNNCDIYGNAYPGIDVQIGGNPTITGCKIHDGKDAGVHVLDNGKGKFNNCDIYGNAHVGICVQTGGNPTVTGCKIHDGKQNGVWVLDNGTGKFNNCDIYRNTYPEIDVQTGGNPMVTGCKIHDGKDAGVCVRNNGKGEFTNCDIYGNAYAGIEVQTGGNPTVTNCKIYDGKNAGVFVLDNGIGKFNNCDIYGNETPGIVVQTDGNPMVTGCKIHDGKDAGVCVRNNGKGEFTNCDIYGNAHAGIYVQTDGNSTITGCKIHDGKQNGVWVHDNGKGEFNNNSLWNNQGDWNIESTAGKVTGTNNKPELPVYKDCLNDVILVW